MKLEAVKNVVTSKFARQILITKKNSPAIMFTAGVAGVLATTILASKATLKMDEVLEESEKEAFNARMSTMVSERESIAYKKTMTLIKVRTAGKIVKLYAPSVAVGAVSIGCLTGAHVTLSRRNVALTAAYAALDKGFNEYRERVLAEVGEDKEREFRYGYELVEVEKKTKDGTQTKTVKRTGPDGHSIYARFFDQFSQNWSKEAEYNRIFIQCQQTYANDLLHSRGHVFLNEIYDALGIERSRAGAVVGWVLSPDGDNYIDFGVFDDKKNPGVRDFVNGREGAILLDFNVDGVIYDKI